MDYYRVMSPPYCGCVSADYARQLMACTDNTFHGLADAEERGHELFFSRRKLEGLFKREDEIKKITECRCSGCSTERVRVPAHVDVNQLRADILNGAWLIMAILLYLGKLHILYHWIYSSTTDPLRAGLLEHYTPDALFRDSTEKRLFCDAYARVVHMFYPVELNHAESKFPPFYRYPDIFRFPFLDEKQQPFQENSRVRKFQIPDEYVSESVKKILADYPGSTETVAGKKQVSSVPGPCRSRSLARFRQQGLSSTLSGRSWPAPRLW